MTFTTDLTNDLDHVFFEDYGVSALLVRGVDSPSAEPTEIRCIVGRGLDRFVDGGYIKNAWEIEFKASDRVRTNDTVKVLNPAGVVVSKYRVGQIADRDDATAIYAAEKLSMFP